jgi:cytidyltransferase-like protein
MEGKIQVARSIVALDRALRRFKRAGKIALVPTMGALHKGHLALVRQARRRADKVIVSIFVNPAQFGPAEDFANYPRSMARDLAALAKLDVDVDLVWAPSADVMYPAGFATRVEPEGAALAGLEDKFRPHFFAGVATVVAKLFIQCRPDFAIFGEKDFQQLKVVARMASRCPRATRTSRATSASLRRYSIARSPHAPTRSRPAARSRRRWPMAARPSRRRASGSTISRRAMPKRWRRFRPTPSGRSGCSSRRASARRG